MLGDVGRGVLEIDPGENQVGPIRERHQRRAHLLPTPEKGPGDFAP